MVEIEKMERIYFIDVWRMEIEDESFVSKKSWFHNTNRYIAKIIMNIEL